MTNIVRRGAELWTRMRDGASVIARVRNPVPIILDRFGLMRENYVVTMRDGCRFEVRSRTSDAYSVYETAVREGGYFRFHTISAGATVVDIGANIGVFTVIAARLVGPKGRVLAVEPHPETAKLLRHNIELNALTNTSVKQVAVAGRAGVVSLHAGDKPLFSSLLPMVNGRPVLGPAEKVTATTLQELLDAEGIDRVDFLKIDCEGSEYEILDTATSALWRRISYVAMEAHAAGGRKPSEVRRKLLSEGYSVREHDLIYGSRVDGPTSQITGMAS